MEVYGASHFRLRDRLGFYAGPGCWQTHNLALIPGLAFGPLEENTFDCPHSLTHLPTLF